MATKTEETRYSKIKRRIENHPLLAVLLLLGFIIIGIGALTDSLDKILSFSQKHLSSTDIANKPSIDDQGSGVQNKSEPIIAVPDDYPIEKESILPPKVITSNVKNEGTKVESEIFPNDKDTSSLISGARLLTVLEPAFTKDRLSIINELVPKLAILSSNELHDVLKLLYPAERVDGLQVLLPYIRRPLSDKEIDKILALFYSKDVPKAVVLLTNSN
jgi:hypothetical protein